MLRPEGAPVGARGWAELCIQRRVSSSSSSSLLNAIACAHTTVLVPRFFLEFNPVHIELLVYDAILLRVHLHLRKIQAKPLS